ncbi:NAD-dependent epimerase [Altericista sp. CCNU0014]|uniref:NAD-dependent epimerase n=1 Tax=Altericista sp. CCNU0014 TaxID=3082949 RepID=UPI00384E40BB
MKILITGVAGFIGYHLARRLLTDGATVCGIDNLNPYYDVTLKRDRLAQLKPFAQFTFEPIDLADRENLTALFQQQSFDIVVNLAAQAGVRYSLDNPFAYIDSNILGFTNLLENCRHFPVKHLLFASSSSVYGANTKVPFAIADNVDRPISLYAATKRANELIAYTYSHLYGIPTTGLRFFTVYGPWGRPDMAYFKFVKAILAGQSLDVYNFGAMERDFTYIDDITAGLALILAHPPQTSESQPVSQPESLQSIPAPPYRLYNIGNRTPVKLLHFIELLEQILGKTVPKNFLPMQPGEVLSTYADVEDLARDFDFRPNTPIEVGLRKFVQWYQSYYSE